MAKKRLADSIKYLRYNESGDFHTQECIEKLDFLSKNLKETFGIISYGYSARKDLDFKNVSFLMKSSGYDNGNTGRCCVFYDPAKVPENYTRCPGSCFTCDLCKIDREINIAFLAHGGAWSRKFKDFCEEHVKGTSKGYKYGKLEVKVGNQKLPQNIMILNMGDAMTCPSAEKGFCRVGKHCYALAAEKNYPYTLPFRQRQKIYWLGHSKEEIWNDFKMLLG